MWANSFPGNYTKYVQLKSELLSRRLKEWELQQRHRTAAGDHRPVHEARLNFHKRPRAKARLLEKIERVDKPEVHDSMRGGNGPQKWRSGAARRGISKSFGAGPSFATPVCG